MQNHELRLSRENRQRVGRESTLKENPVHANLGLSSRQSEYADSSVTVANPTNSFPMARCNIQTRAEYDPTLKLDKSG